LRGFADSQIGNLIERPFSEWSGLETSTGNRFILGIVRAGVEFNLVRVRTVNEQGESVVSLRELG